ncbi:hypothetical protein AX758_12850 [Enterococcus mundtii]|uniref:hypothetical protein n=1 Tax=Enterococcus mundtii TaxID=53346 RepID=UPI0007EEC363|nr:hypothetical protein [Enterococcus mundtii]OBS61381.1 hypothetical protein AX758_12850 [Enterococcus mundtii]
MPIIDFRETGGKFINRMHDANKTNTQEDLSRLAVRIGNESLNVRANPIISYLYYSTGILQNITLQPINQRNDRIVGNASTSFGERNQENPSFDLNTRANATQSYRNVLQSIPQVSIDQRVTAPNELANVTGTVPKQFNSEYVSKKKLKFKRKESSEYKGNTSRNTSDVLQQSLNESRQINPRQQRALSKKSSYLIKKFTSELHDQRVKILNSIQKDEMFKSEVRSSNQEQTSQTKDNELTNNGHTSLQEEKFHLSQEGVDSIKKDTSELHDQEVKSLNTIQKDETSFVYKIHKFEARQSNRNQGTDSRNRTTNMENQGMTKKFVEGSQQASSSQTKDSPNSDFRLREENESTSTGIASWQKGKYHLSQEGLDTTQKSTIELQDKVIQSLKSIQNDDISKFEARPSKRNQGTDSRNRTIYMEKQRMTKEFVEGLQQATSSQTKDNPNSEVSFTTHGEKEIDTVKLRNLNDNPVFEARNIRGENEESLTHGIGESLIKFGEQAYPYRSKDEIYQQAIPTQPSQNKSQDLYHSLANQKTIDLKDTRTGEYILKMIESSDGQNFPAELKDFLKDLQQAPSSQTKDIPIPDFRLREEHHIASNGIDSWQKEKSHLSQESLEPMKKESRELYDQLVHGTSSKKKDVTSFVYGTPKFEARASKGDQRAESLDRLTNIENPGIFKKFSDGLSIDQFSSAKEKNNIDKNPQTFIEKQNGNKPRLSMLVGNAKVKSQNIINQEKQRPRANRKEPSLSI